MKILIDGAGFIGEVHLNILLKYNLAEAAVVETNQDRLEGIVKKYGLKEYYNDIDDALSEGGFDGAVICTPNNIHAEHAVKFLKRGIGVLVEKPMAHNTDDAEKMVEAAESNNAFIYVAYVVRKSDPFIKIKNIIDQGQLGQLFSMRAVVSSRRTLTDAVMKYRGKRSTGGSVIHDYSHEIDYSLWFMDEKVSEVYCKGAKIIYSDWETYDSADILLSFKDNRTSSLHLDYIQPPNRRAIELYGTRGTLLWTDCEDIRLYTEDWAKWINIPVENFYDFDRPYLRQLEHYMDCLKGEKEPQVPGRDGMYIVEIVEKCLESAETGRHIRI
jgi:UDP-N-acetylglucosamine 3-dehydrogenase